MRLRGGEREPWLGVSVSKPVEALYEELVEVPKGIGFVVHKVAPEGPAALAGLRQYDFLWKLDDQLLVNEAQLLVLLRHRGAGATIMLTYQRNGENLTATAVLGERSPGEREKQQADLAVMRGPPVPGLPNQIIDILRRVAEIKGEDGTTVRVERRGEGFWWQHVDAEGGVIKEGDLDAMDTFRADPAVSEAMQLKLHVLVLALADAELRATSTTRPPRVRRVPVGKEP